MPRAFPGFRCCCCCCCCSGPSLACAAAAGRCATDGISTAYARRALATAHAYRPRCSCAGRCHPGRSAVRRQRLCSIVCTRCVRSRSHARSRVQVVRSRAGYLHVEPRRGNVYDRMARAGGDGGALPTPDAPPAGGHTSLERTGNAAPPPARTAGPRRRHGRRCGIVSRFVSIETTARAS